MPDDDKLLILPLGEESKIITQTIANDTARKILELLADSSMSTSAIAKKLDIPLTTAQYNVEKLMEAGLVIVEKTKYSEKGREVKLYAPAKRMIVLVPKNTSNQAIMDALKKYFVLLPIAALISLFIETAMHMRNRSQEAVDLLSNAPGFGFTSASKSAVNDANATVGQSINETMATGDYATQITDGTGAIVGEVATRNTTTGMPGTLPVVAANHTADATYASAPNNFGTPEMSGSLPQPSLEPLAAAPQSLGEQIGQSIGSLDLLNHYGLWFFVGCLLVIFLLAGYELYNRRKGKK